MKLASAELLDPKNDYVFFRVFSEDPALLVDLINAVRAAEPPILEVEILNPRLNAERLKGKAIILDLQAVDEDGQRYNIEMQVRRYHAWGARGTYYLARMLTEQLGAGEDYRRLKPVIGIHLLDFDLFDAPAYQDQGLWCFELRDRRRPEVCLGRELQLNVVELRKADRLGQLPAGLSPWVVYFEHWLEASTMSQVDHAPVRRAFEKLRELSADDEARYWANAREKALRDEATLIGEALDRGREEGREEVREEGREEGLAEGIEKGRRETARAMLQRTHLDDNTVAEITGLPLAEIQTLRTASDSSLPSQDDN